MISARAIMCQKIHKFLKKELLLVLLLTDGFYFISQVKSYFFSVDHFSEVCPKLL